MVIKNSRGFFVAQDGTDLLGYVDVWELQPNFYAQLRSGAVSEESISAHNMLSLSDHRSSLWYIGSIITNPAMRAKSPHTGALVFESLCRVVAQFFHAQSNFPLKILGVGSSPFGRKLLDKWGFNPLVVVNGAKDTRPRFEKLMIRPSEAHDFMSEDNGIRRFHQRSVDRPAKAAMSFKSS